MLKNCSKIKNSSGKLAMEVEDVREIGKEWFEDPHLQCGYRITIYSQYVWFSRC